MRDEFEIARLEQVQEREQEREYMRPPAPLAPFSFQHQDIFELSEAFNYAFAATDAAVSAKEAFEGIAVSLPDQLTDIHENANAKLKSMMLSVLDPKAENSMPRQLHRFTQALQEKLRVEIERKADEQVGRLVGLEEKAVKETKKSLESIAAATLAMRALAESIAKQQLELKRAEARLAGEKQQGWLRRMAGWFS